MTVADCPITLPYGATSAPYTSAHPHRGRDYGCPEGTPLVVAGQQIGLSGMTGHAIGPHCHVQEWHGDYSKTREPQNAFVAGTVVNIDPNGTQGDGSFGKFITIQTADGWNDTYCHLSQINVKVGQVIGGNMPLAPEDEFYKQIGLGVSRSKIWETVNTNKDGAVVGQNVVDVTGELYDYKASHPDNAPSDVKVLEKGKYEVK